MAQYDVFSHTFTTPKGVPVLVFLREGTNDYNTAFSALTEDEYQLKGLDLAGLALDIGGHIGTVTLALAIDNPALHVIVLEPIPANLALLRMNLDANAIADRVTVVEGMAGIAGQGLIRYGFTGTETGRHHAFIGNSTLAVPEGEHTVIRPPVYDLDGLLWSAQRGNETVQLAKVDCEGGEYAFLAASKDSLRYVETFVGEWHPNAPDNGHKTRGDLLALLSDTHEVTFSGPVAGPGGFRAVRR